MWCLVVKFENVLKKSRIFTVESTTVAVGAAWEINFLPGQRAYNVRNIIMYIIMYVNIRACGGASECGS